MRTGSRKESTESRGSTGWHDGLYPLDGGSIGDVPGILSKTQNVSSGSGEPQRGDDAGVEKTPWFAPVDDAVMDCPGGVCPVPWATIPERPELQPDNVNHPSHYTNGGVECIEAIESQLTDEEFRGYLRGNCAKYLWRCNLKGNPVEDLKKCKWYLERLIMTCED